MAHETAQQLAHDIVLNPKTALGVGSATAGSGLATIFDMISTGLGLLAVCLGIVLTTVLIRKHLYEYKMMRQRDQEQYGRRVEDDDKKEA